MGVDAEMKMISWNVNGLRACLKKGFMDFFNEIDSDFFCLQETKLQSGQVDLDLPGYEQFWNYAITKKVIPAPRFSPNINLYPFPTASIRRNTIRKAASLLLNTMIFTL